ncbi:hypothetical protein SDC9_191114 [bioreactor metagenome]|uniref:Uncharacterized protein n=1 Tax=bioreactor metagenome TaxID=1076179 RepID=A0A645I560_9ZZZZ
MDQKNINMKIKNVTIDKKTSTMKNVIIINHAAKSTSMHTAIQRAHVLMAYYLNVIMEPWLRFQQLQYQAQDLITGMKGHLVVFQ